MNFLDDGLVFVASKPLIPDLYNVFVKSGPEGIKDKCGNELAGSTSLAGEFVQVHRFNLSADTKLVSLPRFARGPRQGVNVPAASNDGIPLILNDGSNVRSGTVFISYDQQLLEIGEVTSTVATIEVSRLSLGLVLKFSSPTDLPAGEITLASLRATVPASAKQRYGMHHSLTVTPALFVDANGSEIRAAGIHGLHLNQYLGDTTGNGRLTPDDAVQVAQVAEGSRTALMGSPLLDSLIAADVNGDGVVEKTDAILIATVVSGQTVREIPPIPPAENGGGGKPKGSGKPAVAIGVGDLAPAAPPKAVATATLRGNDEPSLGVGIEPFQSVPVDRIWEAWESPSQGSDDELEDLLEVIEVATEP